MIRYRVIAPMISPAAFTETMKHQQVRAAYFGDEVSGDQADLDRLLAEGYLEVVEDGEQVPA
ncbi:hypothetical protein [Pseudosporangium ferrugineum]|uniref:Uncharacterized protein n=1 Tax=Pseudosporangium ferrugineum TaxID=439699 RepID=A0A2T0RSD8_9ACTN|nr:hypothetical protein [Pseudosporangium ferrugineum]PRY24052.1 hypothetical protein CLV70_114185 [Pseudosporangium ferrugineum]